ncbi:hypothetical protein B9479_000780 [Cryptococcus floricola]|uniref:Xylose isomerase-like TIM barrel domain-containing protein n=1 Tax=Cryptococcus floricola TaxID=2591691 RepID=A0A5D3B8L2_9TREE|nr:hypothetical protein B9479_000780 [Cryptococcus floricola]
MPNDYSGLRWGVATASLGMNPIHDICTNALQKAGFAYTEVDFGEYVAWVRSELPNLYWSEGGEPDPSDTEIWDAFYAKIDDFKALAAKYGLTILILRPLNQFDGWPEGSKMVLCSELGVEQIQERLLIWAALGRPLPLVGKNAGQSVKDGNDMGHANALQTFKAVLDQGWSGIVMFAFFEVLRMSPADPNIPYKYANGAALSEKRLLEALQK